MAKKKKREKPKIVKCCMLVLSMALLALALTSCKSGMNATGEIDGTGLDSFISETNVIDVEPWLFVNFSGYNGYATVTWEQDAVSMDNAVESQAIVEYASSVHKSVPYNTFSYLVSFEPAEEYQNLSNGDTVVMNLVLSDRMLEAGETLESMQKALNIFIPKTSFEFTVEGLEDAKVLDIAGLARDYIVYEHGNGGGMASIVFPEDFIETMYDLSFVYKESNKLSVVTSDRKIIGVYYCSVSPNTALTEGDEISVHVDLLSDYGYTLEVSDEYSDYIIIEDSEPFAVPDLGDYVQAPENVTDTMKQDMCYAIDEYMQQWYDDIDDYAISWEWGVLKAGVATSSGALKDYVVIANVSWIEKSGLFGDIEHDIEKVFAIIEYDDGTYALDEIVYWFGFDSDRDDFIITSLDW